MSSVYYRTEVLCNIWFLDCCWFLLYLHVLLCILQRSNCSMNTILFFGSCHLKSSIKVAHFYPMRPQKVSMSHVTETEVDYPRITLCSPAFFTKERYLISRKGEVKWYKFHVHQCQAQIEIWRSPDIPLTFIWTSPDLLTIIWPSPDPYKTLT